MAMNYGNDLYLCKLPAASVIENAICLGSLRHLRHKSILTSVLTPLQSFFYKPNMFRQNGYTWDIVWEKAARVRVGDGHWKNDSKLKISLRLSSKLKTSCAASSLSSELLWVTSKHETRFVKCSANRISYISSCYKAETGIVSDWCRERSESVEFHHCTITGNYSTLLLH